MVRGKDKNFGNLALRTGSMKAGGNQNMAGGGRYGNLSEIVKQDTNTAFSKVQMLKMQGQAKFPLNKAGDYVELDPVKQGVMASPQQ